MSKAPVPKREEHLSKAPVQAREKHLSKAPVPALGTGSSRGEAAFAVVAWAMIWVLAALREVPGHAASAQAWSSSTPGPPDGPAWAWKPAASARFARAQTPADPSPRPAAPTDSRPPIAAVFGLAWAHGSKRSAAAASCTPRCSVLHRLAKRKRGNSFPPREAYAPRSGLDFQAFPSSSSPTKKSFLMIAFCKRLVKSFSSSQSA